jgi:hypothetical protein
MKSRRPAAVILFGLLGLGGCDRSRSSAPTDSPSASANAPAASSTAPAGAPKADPLAILGGFEGEIGLRATGKTNPTPVNVNLFVKNEVVRMDLPTDVINAKEAKSFLGNGKVYGILHAADKKLTVVLEGKKEAIAIDLDQVGEVAKGFRGHGPGGAAQKDTSPAPPQVTKTTKTETVAGYPCTDWDVVNADKSKLSVCVADKGASFFKLPLTGIPTEHAWALELLDGNHLPLKGVNFDKDGSESGRVEITKLDKKTLDASMFEVPPGYKTVSLEEMLGGLGGGGIPDVPQPGHKGGHGKHHKHKD